MKIGIYGGTFNPPHLGHQAAAETAVKVLGLDKLILIPAAVPPHKQLPEHTPDNRHRVEMTLKMADAMNMPGVVEVSDMEMKREGKSYTSDTLRIIIHSNTVLQKNALYHTGSCSYIHSPTFFGIVG